MTGARLRAPVTRGGGSDRQNAKRRGVAFEQRLARLLGGEVYPGQAGDVTAYGLRWEAKYRGGLEGLGELRAFIDQSVSNTQRSGLPWALALTGGKDYRNAEIYVVEPLAQWVSSRRSLTAASDLDPEVLAAAVTRAIQEVIYAANRPAQTRDCSAADGQGAEER